MKIALCLSGQPRYIDEGYLEIQRNFLSKYDIDCFVHTWWDDSMKNQPMVLSPGLTYNRKYKWKEDTLERIVKYYSPKIIMHQQQIEFETFHDVSYAECYPQFVHSMLYSIMMSNKLKKLYEQSNNFVYDIVIRCRFDIKFNSFNIDLNCLDLNKVYGKGVRRYLIDEKFNISSSTNMDIYSDAFLYLNEYRKDKNYNFRDFSKAFVGENIISHHLYNKNIDVCYMNSNEVDVSTIILS